MADVPPSERKGSHKPTERKNSTSWRRASKTAVAQKRASQQFMLVNPANVAEKQAKYKKDREDRNERINPAMKYMFNLFR